MSDHENVILHTYIYINLYVRYFLNLLSIYMKLFCYSATLLFKMSSAKQQAMFASPFLVEKTPFLCVRFAHRLTSWLQRALPWHICPISDLNDLTVCFGFGLFQIWEI